MTFLRRRNAIVAMAALGAATLAGSALAQQTVTLRPVSYTHLTLPTN